MACPQHVVAACAAVGHPGETIFLEEDGALTVFGGTALGLSITRRRRVEPGTEGVAGPVPAGSPERLFASALAAGDLDGDGHVDLAIGSPRLNASGLERVGGATVLFGSLFADGFESGNPGRWSPQE